MPAGELVVRTGARDDAFAVRRVVFMDEQGYVHEFDAVDDDARCVHLTAYVAGALAGCARVFPAAVEQALCPESPCPPACSLDETLAEPGQLYCLGRVAVLPAFRGHGVARALVRACDDAARAAGARVCKLHAQEYVQGLYASCGYAPIASVDYEDEGQPHVWMGKLL